MASATSVNLGSTPLPERPQSLTDSAGPIEQKRRSVPEHTLRTSVDDNRQVQLPSTAEEWTKHLRLMLQVLYTAPRDLLTVAGYEQFEAAPRRKNGTEHSRSLAIQISMLLYPSTPIDSVSAIIKYETDIVALRRTIRILQALSIEEEHEERLANAPLATKDGRIRTQGPWNMDADPISLHGPVALPMPVEVSDPETLNPIFKQLSLGAEGLDGLESAPEKGIDEYGVDVGVWGKGMLYGDGRLDLCKKVLGPPHINPLMTSLNTNTTVRHFLLGNNIIGPRGADAIASFVHAHPDRMETWYLAGNCIDSASFSTLVGTWTTSNSITNIWLKRNPLGAGAVEDVVRLILHTRNLRTLDLDLTELSNDGTAQLFDALYSHLRAGNPSPQRLPLQNLYLNAVGISTTACAALATFLVHPSCPIQNLYLSYNPIGDAGAEALAKGLKHNKSLRVLCLASCGINTAGASAIFEALHQHPNLYTLSLGQGYATRDIGVRYNYLEDGVVPSLVGLLGDRMEEEGQGLEGDQAGAGRKVALKQLTLDSTALSADAIEYVTYAASHCRSLLEFSLRTVHVTSTKGDGSVLAGLRASLQSQLEENVAEACGGMAYDEFRGREKRWLVSPRDVRFIDSGYRNSDMDMARRGKLQLKKWWDDGDETLAWVMGREKAWANEGG